MNTLKKSYYTIAVPLENPAEEYILKFRIWNSSRLSILSKCSQSLVILNNLDG